MMTDAALTMPQPRRPRRLAGFGRWLLTDIRGAVSLGFLLALMLISVLAPWISPVHHNQLKVAEAEVK